MFHTDNSMSNKLLTSSLMFMLTPTGGGKPLLTLWHRVRHHQVNWNNACIHVGLNAA